MQELMEASKMITQKDIKVFANEEFTFDINLVSGTL